MSVFQRARGSVDRHFLSRLVWLALIKIGVGFSGSIQAFHLSARLLHSPRGEMALLFRMHPIFFFLTSRKLRGKLHTVRDNKLFHKPALERLRLLVDNDPQGSFFEVFKLLQLMFTIAAGGAEAHLSVRKGWKCIWVGHVDRTGVTTQPRYQVIVLFRRICRSVRSCPAWLLNAWLLLREC